MIQLSNICFEYKQGELLLKNVSLHIEAGECVVITGASGSGKTTLGRVINGLIPHYYEGNLTGDVSVNGLNPKEVASWELSQTIGSVFQNPKSQFFTSIVEDELVFEMGNYGLKPETISNHLERVLQETDLQSLRHQEVMTLSSGQKQKVAIAATQLVDPSVYVMDEPSANLDLLATQQLSEELHKLKEKNKTIVVIEHRLHYLMEFADRIIYMKDGQIDHIYTSSELLALSEFQREQLGLRATQLITGAVKKSSEKFTVPCCFIEEITVQHRKAKKPTVLNLSTILNEHEVVALIGKNGVGKTTLARTIMGLQKERSGQFKLRGERLSAKQRLKKVWFVMQDTVYQLFTDSVWNEVLLNQEEQSERVEQLLKELDLWKLKDRHPATLSGGEKQRLVLAIGIMQQADIFVLDEPTSGLDGFNLKRVAQLIRKLSKQAGHVLVITHDHELVAKCCDRVIRLEAGQIISDCCMHELEYKELIEMMSL